MSTGLVADPNEVERLRELVRVGGVKPSATELAAFVVDLFKATDWPGGGGLDGFDFQDLAVKHGLLLARTVTEPCGEGCSCAEYHGTDDMAEGVTCYRKAQWLADAARAATEASVA